MEEKQKTGYEPLLCPRSSKIDPERAEKRCAGCHLTKPITDFGKCRGRRDRRHWRCLPCARQHNAEYNAKHLEKMRTASKLWRERNKGYQVCHSVGIPFQFGMTLYRDFLKQQDGRCAICRRKSGEGNVKLGFDHDHRTGIIRGLLCNPCNFLIGRGQDNINIFFAAIAYLKNAGRINGKLPLSQWKRGRQ